MTQARSAKQTPPNTTAQNSTTAPAAVAPNNKSKADGPSWVKRAAVGVGVAAAVAPSHAADVVSKVGSGMFDTGTIVANGIGNVSMSAASSIGNYAPGVMEAMGKASLSAGKTLLSGLEATGNWYGDQWTKFGDKTGITEAANKVGDSFMDATNQTADSVAGAVNKTHEGFWQDFANPLKNGADGFFGNTDIQIGLAAGAGIVVLLCLLKLYDMYQQKQQQAAQTAQASPQQPTAATELTTIAPRPAVAQESQATASATNLQAAQAANASPQAASATVAAEQPRNNLFEDNQAPSEKFKSLFGDDDDVAPTQTAAATTNTVEATASAKQEPEGLFDRDDLESEQGLELNTPAPVVATQQPKWVKAAAQDNQNRAVENPLSTPSPNQTS